MIENGAIGKYSAVLESYHGNEETDTCGNGVFQRCGHHLKDDSTQITDAYQDKQNTLNKYSGKCKLPWVAHGYAHGLDEKYVEGLSNMS